MAPKSVTFRRHDHLVSVLFGDLLSHSYNITFSMFLYLVCCQPVYSQYQHTHSLQDPTTIEHETAPSGAIYAVVDKPKRGSSKKSEPVYSQNQHTHSLQDPNTIEHQTAPSGDIYTEVDKPKRGSSKKSEPDVVPPGSGGVSH